MRSRWLYHTLIRRWFRPPRTLRPTREGWWYLVLVMAVGVAATNTGNNLLYLVLSMMLAGIVVSGLLSEQSLRGITVRRQLVGPIFAGQPAFGRLLVSNQKRRLRSFSLRFHEPGPTGTPRLVAYLPHLAPGAKSQMRYGTRFERRGPIRLAAIQSTTAFPFGLFVKATRPEAGEEVLVLPRVSDLQAHLVRALGDAGASARPKPGAGEDLHDVRPYRDGDDPRLIHWKQSAKLDRPMVKELESENGGRLTLILRDPARSPRDPGEIERLEQDIQFVASVAAHLLRADGELELHHREPQASTYRGEAHLLRVLEYLARYAPPNEAGKGAPLDTLDVAPGNPSMTVWVGQGRAMMTGPADETGHLFQIPAPVEGMPQ